MRQPWASVDRWGPGAISVLCLLVVIALSWQYSTRLARVETAYAVSNSNLQHQVDQLRSQISSADLANRVKTLEEWRAKLDHRSDAEWTFIHGRIEWLPWHPPGTPPPS